MNTQQPAQWAENAAPVRGFVEHLRGSGTSNASASERAPRGVLVFWARHAQLLPSLIPRARFPRTRSPRKLVFAAIFPVSLLLVLQNGGQLFTGNTASTSMAYYEGRITLPQVLKNWAITAAGNLVGCLGMAMVAYFSDLLVGGTQALSVALAIKKCAYAWGPTMVKAVMCNWLVCMATFLATSASDTVGKVVGIWFPISMFVAIGFEHLEANMFILPASILAGAPFSLGEIFVKNLIPVMLGNAFAGAFIVGAGFAFSQAGRAPSEVGMAIVVAVDW